MAKKKIKFEYAVLKPAQIIPNRGQLKGLPSNPRFIRDKAFEDLKQDMIDDPHMIEFRRVLVMPFNEKHIIVAGEMRFRGKVDLKAKGIPCIIIPPGTDMKLVRGWAIKDNLHSGKDDWDIIANEWDIDEFMEFGKVMPFTGESDNKKTSNIRITITEAGEDEREKIKALLTKAGYKVK